jgi:hypothetical protein
VNKIRFIVLWRGYGVVFKDEPHRKIYSLCGKNSARTEATRFEQQGEAIKQAQQHGLDPAHTTFQKIEIEEVVA